MSRGSGRVEEGRPARPRRGRQAAGAVASSRSPRHLSACSGESKQLAGAGQHSAGPPGGLPGKFSAFCSLFSFYLFLYCVLK